MGAINHILVERRGTPFFMLSCGGVGCSKSSLYNFRTRSEKKGLLIIVNPSNPEKKTAFLRKVLSTCFESKWLKDMVIKSKSCLSFEKRVDYALDFLLSKNGEFCPTKEIYVCPKFFKDKKLQHRICNVLQKHREKKQIFFNIIYSYLISFYSLCENWTTRKLSPWRKTYLTLRPQQVCLYAY